MREIELKAVVANVAALKAGLNAAGARLTFAGPLHDRRYDTADGAMVARDHVLRLRTRHATDRATSTTLDWKGPTQFVDGYKVREEISTAVSDAAATHALLDALGFHVIREIDRDIELFALDGAVIRIEQYPRLDVLVEVEGSRESIERAIACTGLPRRAFTPERLSDFAVAFEARTGERAALCARELAGDYRYRLIDA
jgi:predicted adenylyl cyclase CyaB